MPKYKFNQWNVELLDPDILISSDNISIFPSNSTIDVDVVFVTEGGRFGLRLTDVPVENLNYSADTLRTRVLDKLKDYIV